MNKIEMQLQHLNNQLMQEWFENYCHVWVEHYNWILSVNIWNKADEVWFREQINIHKIYDV